MEDVTDVRRQYWRKNLQYLGLLLSVWFLVSYGFGILFVEQMDRIRLGGFKLGFWFAQQGSRRRADEVNRAAFAWLDEQKDMAHPKSSATQHRKKMPRMRDGRFAMLCSFLRVNFVSSSFVLA
ncbi:MAG: DUF4212 domain-containing protein [Myxococcales bacterium]|nr:DUF4212 domain-containing protein [Myxococcales bacterium]